MLTKPNGGSKLQRRSSPLRSRREIP